jgi:uncharacterized protein (TIGR02646 family)
MEPIADQAWKQWVAAGRAARDALLESKAEKPARLINEDLYKAQRDRFLAATHGKCAYCERKIIPGQRKGDVEHYRPKGRVKKADGGIVMINRNGALVEHPGYYWLAYEWENLLPSCLACNRPGTDDASGTVTGKADRFPLEGGSWAASPDEIEHERPALLNPWRDNPSEHLTFDPLTGVVGYQTERGRVTIEVLGLNRDGLPEARKGACVSTLRAIESFMSGLVRADEGDRRVQEDRATLREVKDGSAEFAAICSVVMARALQRQRQEIEALYPPSGGGS